MLGCVVWVGKDLVFMDEIVDDCVVVELVVGFWFLVG